MANHEGTEHFARWYHDAAWTMARRRMVQAGVPEQNIDSTHDPGRDCFLSWDTEAFHKAPKRVLEVSPIDAIDEGGVRRALEKLQARNNPDKEKERQAAIEELAAKEHLKKLYDRYIRHRLDPKQGTRNTATVAAATFLYRAVSEEVLRELLSFFYRVNQTEFLDTHEEHMQDVENCLKGNRKTWLAGLNEGERQVYESLGDDEKVAFRICRDLGTENEAFYMGQMGLAERLSLKPGREVSAAAPEIRPRIG